MNFDKVFEIVRKVEISDDMGGFEILEEIVGTLKAFTSPVTVEVMLKDYGVVSNSALKIFTESELPRDHIHLKYEDKDKNTVIEYEILQISDYEKYKMLLVQVI